MFAYVGCYSTPDRNGHGDGIKVFHVPDEGGAWQPIQHIATHDNPSFLRLGPNKAALYAVHGGRSAASAYAIDHSSGKLTPLGLAETAGRNPVDFGITQDGRHMVVAHYSSGSMAVLPVREDHTLGDAQQSIRLEGATGPRIADQPAPLPHGVTPDPTGRYLLVPDKGLDVVLVYELIDGALVETSSAPALPGSGPRHAVFHPTLPILYAVCELGCSVQIFAWDDGLLHPGAAVSALMPGGRDGLAAEIAISSDGRWLYSSNRGDDSIARFAVAADGTITLCETTPLPGHEPRFFTIAPSGRHLYVAQQTSDSIVCFDITNGALSAPRVVAEIGTPVAIALLTP